MTHGQPCQSAPAQAGAPRFPALAGFFVCALLWLSGCATPQLTALSAAWPADVPDQAQVSGVPFFPQADYQCGPAALAMVAQSAGVPVTPEQLVDQVYLPGRQGSLQPEMLASARRQGLVAYPLAPELNAVLRELAAGNPVLVFQNLSLPIYPIWHYAVAIGYDRSRSEVVLHSGTTERLTMSLATFERTWARGERWAMLALPTSRLPASATPDAYASAVATLERTNPGAALTAYTTGLQTWPQHRGLLFGRGNAAYAQGQRAAAAQAYEAAAQADPDFADAWNNLAQVQLELGQRPQAAKAIARAVALGGPREARYRDLQRKINEKGAKP
ncbi:MAG: PA2778 family cysteine peptidase [Pseudomonadota bacterium]